MKQERPQGSNADEWCAFLKDNAAAPEYCAVQISEAIESAHSDLIHKLTWQVRDTCARAEKAERELSKENQ